MLVIVLNIVDVEVDVALIFYLLVLLYGLSCPEPAPKEIHNNLFFFAQGTSWGGRG
jgi:hypothetical protein